MEVSSQGLMLDRVTGIDFDIGVFTNLSPDHIGENEHRSLNIICHVKNNCFKCVALVYSTRMMNINRYDRSCSLSDSNLFYRSGK
ncbi:MAG: Mur ligase family protein [Longibaculum sp.]